MKAVAAVPVAEAIAGRTKVVAAVPVAEAIADRTKAVAVGIGVADRNPVVKVGQNPVAKAVRSPVVEVFRAVPCLGQYKQADYQKAVVVEKPGLEAGRSDH